MELFGASVVKLSLLAVVLVLAIWVYYANKAKEKNKVIKELNAELKKAVDAGDLDTVRIILLKLREIR